MCRQCPAGREGRHIHLHTNCKYGFSQVNRGGFGNERGRGGFGILRRQN
jgi:hypothetical protein